jgi:hypothetical protein
VATALAVNTGSAGAVVLFNGAGGTPSSLTLTNATGLPLTTGVTGALPLANGGTGEVLADPGADRILFWDDSAGDVTWLTAGSGLTITGTTLTATAAAQPYNLTVVIDGGGAVLTTGMKGCTAVPVAGTIVSATVLSNDASVTSGSVVVDLWEDTLDNYPPTDADSITAAAPPTLSSATNSFDSTLTGWSTALVNGGTAATTSIVCANVDSATSVTKVTVVVRVQP